jgi:hypothetical protein
MGSDCSLGSQLTKMPLLHMFILSFYEVALEDNILKKREIVFSVIQLTGCHFSIHLWSLLVYPISGVLPSVIYASHV